LQFFEYIFVKVIDTCATIGLDVKCGSCHSVLKKPHDCFYQVGLKFGEQELQVIVEEVNDYLVSCSVHLLVAGKLFVITYADCRKDKLRQLREYAVIVVLTDGKVDIVASNHVDVEVAQLLYMLPLAFVLVLHLFVAETIP